jgi:hypothetical protein
LSRRTDSAYFEFFAAGSTTPRGSTMAMTAKLFSISGLAIELDRDRRTIGKALARVPPDGKTADGGAAWHLTTALAALDRNEGRRRSDSGGDDGDIREVEFAARKLHELFERLRAEPDVGKRRAMVEAGQGKVVGEFIRAVEAARSGNSEAVRLVEEPYVLGMHGGAIGELFRLCDWKLADDDKAA